MSVAVVGAGWAGLAAAVRARQAGHAVEVFEMAAQAGGRARGVEVGPHRLDNGQHILIGAYQRTLALMRELGADPDVLLHRRPLELRYPDGRGLATPPGHPILAFVRAVAGCRGWTWRDRSALLTAAGHWLANGFRCDERLTVDQLCAALPPAVRELLVDPLCVAALNTPATEASASVFLRVLHDALFGARGSADLLIARGSLDTLLPAPARAWLAREGVPLHLGRRVQALSRDGEGWRVDGRPFDQVLLACSAAEAARLLEPHDPAWAAQALALRYEPIVTVYLHCSGARLPAPMTALVAGSGAPAQFAFDLGAIGGPAGVFAFVVSGAQAWVDAGLEATGRAVLRQARGAFADRTAPASPVLLKTLAEKRATFRCTPALARPAQRVAEGLFAAGDYVEGPYPSTLEGAVRSGEQAAALLNRVPRPAPPAPAAAVAR